MWYQNAQKSRFYVPSNITLNRISIRKKVKPKKRFIIALYIHQQMTLLPYLAQKNVDNLPSQQSCKAFSPVRSTFSTALRQLCFHLNY